MGSVMGKVALGQVGVLVCGGMKGWETLPVERRGVGKEGEFVSSIEMCLSKPNTLSSNHTLSG